MRLPLKRFAPYLHPLRPLYAQIDDLQRTQAQLRMELRQLQRAARAPVAVAATGHEAERNGSAEGPASRPDLDVLYATFEDRFRGGRDTIRDRLRVYLPYVARARRAERDGEGAGGAGVIDLGCGRGEWLDLLRAEGHEATGVDSNGVFVEECRGGGLRVVESDVMVYLRSVPAAMASMVTGFHLIEHLPFPTLVDLFDETLRVLAPGGIAIFETLNPGNVQVGACTFYTDPTHVRPLPSTLTSFLAESRGFVDVEVLPVNAYERPEHVDSGCDVAKWINHHFYGPRDYAVIARRPGAR